MLRGFWGGFCGRVDVYVVYVVYLFDNRLKRVVVLGVDFIEG